MFRNASSSPAVLTTSKSGDNTNEVTDTDSIDEQGRTKRAKRSVVDNVVDTSKSHYIRKYGGAFSPIDDKNNLMKRDLIPTPVNFDMSKDGLITQAEMKLFIEDHWAWEDGEDD